MASLTIIFRLFTYVLNYTRTKTESQFIDETLTYFIDCCSLFIYLTYKLKQGGIICLKEW